MTDQSSSTVSRKIRTLIPIPCSAWAATRSRNRVSTEYGDTGRAWRTRDYSDRTCDRECHLHRLGCTSSALADCPEAVVKALANRPFPLPHFARSWGRAFTGTRQVSLRSSGRLHRSSPTVENMVEEPNGFSEEAIHSHRRPRSSRHLGGSLAGQRLRANE